MAQNNRKVLLGYEDELITEKYKGQVNFTTNKIGGKPEAPPNIKLDSPNCPLCQLPRPLVFQIYAPLENSTYHRTLYVFACINPNCWNRNESWSCIRAQTQQENLIEKEATNNTVCAKSTDWCAEADDWDDNNSNLNQEENGNLINNNECASEEEEEEDDDESCSFEEALRAGLGNLTVDDRNANIGAQGGAVGRLHSPAATAEIEGDEGEVISIDTPTIPQQNIAALLQEVTPLPRDFVQNSNAASLLKKSPSLTFVSSFMSVWEETFNSTSNISETHVKDLLQEYQQQHINEDGGVLISPDSVEAAAPLPPIDINNVYEKYEKSNPAHGDKMFHHFLTKIQQNPGQILRYCRDVEQPILLYPLQEVPKKCDYCKGELVFECQVLPTIIPKLRLTSDQKNCARLEFGTVLIYTCQKSCWSTTDNHLKFETIVLQSEI